MTVWPLRDIARLTFAMLLSFVFFSGAVPRIVSTEDLPRDVGVNYVFYGFVPGGNQPEIHVLAYEDGTRISVYDITALDVESSRPGSASLIAEETMNARELYKLQRGADTYFKVVADKKVSVFIFGGENRYSAYTFYPAADGRYVGKEFVFETGLGLDNIIFAVEDAIVTIYDSEDNEVSTFPLAESSSMVFTVNETAPFPFDRLKVYRVVSTGDIMIQNYGGLDGVFCPSTDGGFMGRVHFGYGGNQLFVFAYEPCTVAIYNLTVTGPVEWRTHAFAAAGEYLFMSARDHMIGTPWFDPPNHLFVSTGKTTVFKGGELEGHISRVFFFMNVVPGKYDSQKAEYFFWQDSSGPGAYIFAPAPAQVTIGDREYVLGADEHLNIHRTGLSHVESNRTIFIQVLNNQAEGWQRYLISATDFPATHPEMEEEGPLMTQYLIIGAAAVAVVAVVILRKRRP